LKVDTLIQSLEISINNLTYVLCLHKHNTF